MVSTKLGEVGTKGDDKELRDDLRSKPRRVHAKLSMAAVKWF
jgi:hypothetical protein